MKLGKFYCATQKFNDLTAPHPAYYFRQTAFSQRTAKARLRVAVSGLYELWFNGEKITRGFLSPYFSNPNHIIYYDEYEITCSEGKNVFTLLLGNGFHNNPGGYIWDFDKADFRSAPIVSTELISDAEISLSPFRIHPSPIRFDDYRFGEVYDARFETDGFCDVTFDDSSWELAKEAKAPLGEIRRADVPPIVCDEEIKPISVTRVADGYIYDFGESNAGVCRLSIIGERGQRIELRHADSLSEGDLNLVQVWFLRNETWDRDREIVHRDVYICRGGGREIYQPSFTYHGFRYVKVSGITEGQATKELLTFRVYHTSLATRGGFSTSDKVLSELQTMTRRSILSNFYHFPTDCPQREKNGWTADAALSAEAALLNFDPERCYREWMRNIRLAQRADGALPGIVPTGGWGFEWGNGPAWDSVLAYLPYFTFIYRGECEMIRDSQTAFISYLKYLRRRADGSGLLAIGLGDWCHVGGIEPKAPLILTDSIMAMDIASKIAEMLYAIGERSDADLAAAEAKKYRLAIREHLIDKAALTARGECQTSQAMSIFYGVFEDDEKEDAFLRLLDFISEADNHMDLGVLGGRVIFHVLSEFGYSDLAYKMIARPDYPSYGNWILRGATTLWENFLPDGVSSMNHHFWGDISAWFIKCIAGIRINPEKRDTGAFEIRPSFISEITHAEAFHDAVLGRISSAWVRDKDGIILTLQFPEGMHGTVYAPRGYAFSSGEACALAECGEYRLIKKG